MEDNSNTDEKEKSKIKRLINFILILIVLLIIFNMFFHLINHDGKTILMSTDDLLFEDRRKYVNHFGRVVGNYTLKTEYGEIVLKNRAEIEVESVPMAYKGIISIAEDNFKTGRATHNLAIDGQELPKNLSIEFFDDNKISSIYFYDDDMEINISDISIMVDGISFNKARQGYKDINHSNIMYISRYDGNVLPEITLADSTQIMKNIPEMKWLLFHYYDTDTWELYAYTHNAYSIWSRSFRGKPEHYFLVQHPGENELKRYVSITFRKDWGEFIEGVLVEENESVFENIFGVTIR